MLGEIAIAGYIIAAGFVAAGVIASFYQLVTAQPARFDFSGGGVASGLATIVICMFAGPVILMRNALRGRRIERRPLGWLLATLAIASGWSLCSGVVVMEFALAIRASLV